MKTHAEFVRELKGINPNIQVIGIYTRAADRIDVKCKVCGHTWSPRAYSLTQGKGCAHCSAVQGAKGGLMPKVIQCPQCKGKLFILCIEGSPDN